MGPTSDEIVSKVFTKYCSSNCFQECSQECSQNCFQKCSQNCFQECSQECSQNCFQKCSQNAHQNLPKTFCQIFTIFVPILFPKMLPKNICSSKMFSKYSVHKTLSICQICQKIFVH